MGQQEKASDLRSVALSMAIGGSGFDIRNGDGGCSHFECRAHTIDHQAAEVFHFFDYLVMQGPDAEGYHHSIDRVKSDEQFHAFTIGVAYDVQTLLHLRRIRASDYVFFIDKPAAFCKDHYFEGIGDLGLTHLMDPDALTDVAKRLARTGAVSVEEVGPSRYIYRYDHPLLNGLPLVMHYGRKIPKYKVVEGVLVDYLFAMLGDLVASRASGSPLVRTAPVALFDGTIAPSEVTVQEVAARLTLPVLSELDTESLIKLREYEYAHFERFRSALTIAIAETIEKTKEARRSPQEIAAIVLQEHIRPALADIERKLAASSTSMTRKLLAGLSVGATSVAFGALAAMPSIATAGIVTAGLGAAATTLPHIYKHFEDRQSIESTADMFFLWKTIQRSGR